MIWSYTLNEINPSIVIAGIGTSHPESFKDLGLFYVPSVPTTALQRYTLVIYNRMVKVNTVIFKVRNMVRHWNSFGLYYKLCIQPICTMNHVPSCCDDDLRSYRRLADYPFEKNHQ